MADVATAPSSNQQVPLDTIPISPTEGSSGESNEKSGTNASEATDSEVKTVFHDPENFNVKHPLMNTWTLWFTKPPSGKVRSSCGCANRLLD
jgi:translation initiation factor 4E